LSGGLGVVYKSPGATLVIDSDAHAVEELEWTVYGAATARRGWATAERVGNTRGLDAVLRRKVT
jgi:histidinol phosphatase-like PHP family hydrolase